MIDRFEIITINEETKESIELTQWVWNSHWWVELSPGYCKCKWCGMQHTSEIPVTIDYPLCEKNYAVRELIKSCVCSCA